MPGIHFDITGDNSNIVNVVNDTTQRMENMADLMKGLSNSFDFSDAASSMKALNQAIVGNNVVIEEYKNQLEDLAQKQRDAAMAGNAEDVKKYGDEMTTIAGRIQETVAENEQLIDSLNTIRGSMEDANEEMEESEGIMVKLLGGTKNYNDIVGNLPGPLKQAVTGLNGMVKAAKAFIATPLGAVLAALILAYKAVTTWLHKSAEGQQALARISGYLQGVLTALRQIVMNVGKAIYNAFAHPKEAINSLGQAIKNGIIARLEASKGVIVNFGKMLGSALKGNFKEAGEAAKAMADNFQKQFTGKSVEQIKEGAKGFGEQVKNIHATGKEMSELSARENKLHRDRTAWAHEEEELEKQIAEERNKLRMGSQADRAAAAKRMQELVDKKTAKNVELAREEYEIKKRTNELSDSSQEDLDEEERLRARVVQLETQGVTQKGFALRIQDSMNRQMGRASEQMKELVERVNEFNESLGEKSEDVQRNAASLVVSSMREGFEKEMAELALEKEQRMAALDKEHKERLKKIESLQKAEYKARHGGSAAGFKFDENNELVIRENTIYSEQVRNEEARTAQQEKNMLDSRLDKYKDFNTQRKELEREYDDDILYLTTELAKAQAEVMTADAGSAQAKAAKKRVAIIQAALKEADKKEKEALEKFYQDWAKSGDDEGFARWFDELSQQSFLDLSLMLDDLEFQMNEFGDSLPDDEVAKLRAQIVLLKKAIKDNKGDDGIAATAQNAIPNWKELNDVLNETASCFQQIGDMIGGTMGDAIKLAGTFATAAAKIGNANEAIKKAEETGDTSGKIGGYAAIVGAALSVTSKLVSLINNQKEYTEQLSIATNDYYNTLQKIADSHLIKSFSNAFGTNAYGAFVASMGIAKEANDAIDDNIKKYKEWAKAIGGLYDAASGTTAFSDRFASGLYSDMRTAWQRYWGTGKDNEFYASWEQFFDESGNLLGDELRAWVEKYGEGMDAEARKIVDSMLNEFDRIQEAKNNISGYLGDMSGDIASNLASSMVDSFIATGDAIQDMSKYMNDFAKNVANSIVQSKLMAKVFKEEDQDAIADLLAAGKTSDAIAYFNGMLEKVNNLAPEINSFLAGLDLQKLETEAGRTGLSQGIATASQDSVDALSGMMTVVQGHTFEIKESLTGFSAQYETLIANTAAMLEHTQGIHVDTTEIKEIQAQIAELSRSINSNVSTIVDRGVTMRG